MGSILVNFLVQSFPAARVIGKSVVQKLDAGLNDRTIQDLWESNEFVDRMNYEGL